MSEELIQRNLLKNPPKIGAWEYYNIGATSIAELKAHGIIRSVDYGSFEKKKVDGIVVSKKQVIAVIEHKKPSTFNTPTKQEKAIAQEFEVAKVLGCKLLIVTDSKETIWINTLTGNRILDEDRNPIVDQFDPSSPKLAALIEKINYSINDSSDGLKPKKLVNPTDLAKQIWQDVWSVSGATPENCLYTFVELFIFKYLSDLEVLKGMHSFDKLLQSYSTNTDDEVLEQYATVVRSKIKELFPESVIDHTTIINGTIFVSKDQKAVKGYSAVFKKVLFKFRDYGKLEYIDVDFKSQLFESFLKESISKKNWGQFFTPIKVVRAILEMCKEDIREGFVICDPACGVGKFLLEAVASRAGQFFEVADGGVRPTITLEGFDKGFDKDEQKTIILAKANMLIYLSDLIKENPNITKSFSQLFNDTFSLKTNSILGTLSDPVTEKYDLILTNPPYVTSGSSNLKDEIKKSLALSNYYKVSGMGVEGLFMEWIVKALKPRGKAYVVIPDGLLLRQNDQHLRKFIYDNCFIDGIISLPLNTFFTTNKKTYILAITKKSNVLETQTDPVFTYLVSEMGESRDIYRFDIDQNDLAEAATLFSFFKGAKQKFSKYNTDPRCKTIPIDFFAKSWEIAWDVENLWSNEEKIDLGVMNAKNQVSLEEYAMQIEAFSATTKQLQEEILNLNHELGTLIKFKHFKISELFDIKKGNGKFTRKFGNENKGDYSVYSASNNDPLTHINTFDFDGEFLTWATNGFAGYIKIISGKFSINSDRGLLKPKVNDIDIWYVKYKLEPILREIAKGRKGPNGEDEFTKVYPSMVELLELAMPVKDDDTLDLETQKSIADLYSKKAQIDMTLRRETERVLHLEVVLDENNSPRKRPD